jgi:NAD(P)-dependent dehydrogenase (short-subunit alcohol dehydrogenase family)
MTSTTDTGFSPKLLAGKVGIVTGAGSPHGIGRSLVLSLALAGAAAVYATDLTVANIPSLQEEAKNAGSTCRIHGAILDVTSEEQTITVLKDIIATYGRLDFYFANAGFGSYKSVEYLPIPL